LSDAEESAGAVRTAPAATPGLVEVEAAMGLVVAAVAVIAGAAANVRVVVAGLRTAAVGFARLAWAVGRGVGRAAGRVVAPVAGRPTSSADATSLSGVAAC
jgi:hypothetical protein